MVVVAVAFFLIVYYVINGPGKMGDCPVENGAVPNPDSDFGPVIVFNVKPRQKDAE